MPVNTWNFYRAVSVGSDHKSWLSQNPQVCANVKVYLTIKAKNFLCRLKMGELEEIRNLNQTLLINISMRSVVWLLNQCNIITLSRLIYMHFYVG